MAYKNEKVRSVRLSTQLAEKVDGMAKELGIPVSSLLRSFVLSCVYSLPSSVEYWVKRDQPSKKRSKSLSNLSTGDNNIDVGSQNAKLEISKSRNIVAGNLPYVSDGKNDLFTAYMRQFLTGVCDDKGNIIPDSTWRFVMGHRNYACPCGSGKKFKSCHGISEE